MTRPVDAIVTGFTKNAELSRRAFAPLLALRQEGIIRDIHYVTWDSEALNEFVTPVKTLDGVTITRVPQPDASGNPNQRGIVYQTCNLEAALAQIAEPDALVVKLRPDFVFRADFLKSKLQSFETDCTIPSKSSFDGVNMPRSPFARKIWIPWADANQPFFYEDAAYIGLKRDLEKLAAPDTENRTLADMNCGSLVHVLRYIHPFLPRFPIFRRYIENYGAFANDLAYRKGLVGMLLGDGFFWHLLVAHAWIMHTSFHIDGGETGDVAFYPNTVNADTDWRDLAAIKQTPPYDNIGQWRESTRAGNAIMPAVMRTYGRLVDDMWPRSVFAARIADMPDGMIARLARGVALYETGCLNEIEAAFYKKLRAFHEEHWVRKQAA